MSLEASQIIKLARDKRQEKQRDFAIFIGKSQAMLSKYENKKASPPGDLIILCMNILEEDDDIERLISKIKHLSGDKYCKHREALHLFIDSCLESPKK